MLGFVLFNYARTVQNISIKKIYYGAFETLGDPREIEKNYPNAEDRKVPIFDLTSFVTLQDWANISNEFINLGESQNFEKISGKNSDLALQLDDLVKSIRTSRGGKLVYGFDFEGLQQKIKAAKNEESPNQQQMERLLSKIEEKVNHFKNDDIINGFHAVKWCIDYQLIPQGYTLLQETVRTWLLIKMGYAKKKITDYKFRSMADIALNDIPKWKMDEATGEYITNKNGHRILKWRGVQRYERDKIEEIERMIQYVAQFKGLIEQFARITGSGLRNDINHGGFNDDPASPEDLKNELQDLYTKIKNILKL